MCKWLCFLTWNCCTASSICWGVSGVTALYDQEFIPLLWPDSRTRGSFSLFKAQIFLPSIKTCKKQLQLRFDGHNTIVSKFSCILPSVIVKSTTTDLSNAAKTLLSLNPKDLATSLADELLDLKEMYLEDLQKIKSPLQLVNYLFEKDLALL